MAERYTEPDEVKARIELTDNQFDGSLDQIIRAVMGLIDGFTNHPDGFIASDTATAREFSGTGADYLWIGEAVEITAVAVKSSLDAATYTAWEASDWDAFSGSPDDPDWNRTPYHGILIAGSRYSYFPNAARERAGFRAHPDDRVRRAKNVQITARWGYADEVPGPVAEACIIQSGRLLKRGMGAFADALSVGDTGQLLYRAKLDPDLRTMIEKARLIRPVIG